MTAAFAALKDKAARTLLGEEPQQAGRRHVEIRPNARLLKIACVFGLPACEDGEGRPVPPHNGRLLRAQRGVQKAQQPHAP